MNIRDFSEAKLTVFKEVIHFSPFSGGHVHSYVMKGGVNKTWNQIFALDPHRLLSILKQQTPVTVSSSRIRGMVGMMM